MLEAGKCRSIAEIAEAEKVDRAYVSRLLDLTLLAPDIQEAILEGRQAKGIQLDELTGAMPGVWEGASGGAARAHRRQLGRARKGRRVPPDAQGAGGRGVHFRERIRGCRSFARWQDKGLSRSCRSRRLRPRRRHDNLGRKRSSK